MLFLRLPFFPLFILLIHPRHVCFSNNRRSSTSHTQKNTITDTAPPELPSLISVMYGGSCAISDPGCYLCISSINPGLGCAACAQGYKKVTPSLSTPLTTTWSMGRRAILGTNQQRLAPAVPYCLGSPIKATLENDVLVNVGELKSAINETVASVQGLFRDPMRTVG